MTDSNPEGTVTDEVRTAMALGLLDSEESNPEVEEELVAEDEFDEEPDQDEDDSETLESADEEEEDGQDEESTDEELEQDRLRLADYTRKTQELAREREAVQAELQAVQQERQLYAQYLGQLAQATMPQKPDYEALQKEHGIEAAMQAKIRYDSAMENYQSLSAEQQRAQQVAQQAQAKARAEWMREEQERLLAARPEWKDPAQYSAAAREIEEFAVGLGYTEAQLAEVSHRDILVLDAARQWHAAQGKAKKVKPKQGRVVRPGAKGQVRGKSRAEKARKRLQATGSDEAAAEVLRGILG